MGNLYRNGEGESPAEAAERKRFAAIPSEALWSMLIVGTPAPGRWHCYHIGELHKGGRNAGLAARELYRRGLAELAQRREKGVKGFGYLIMLKPRVQLVEAAAQPEPKEAAIREPAKPVSFAGRAIADGRDPSASVQNYLRAFRGGQPVAAIARESGVAYQTVYDALKRHGLVTPRRRADP